MKSHHSYAERGVKYKRDCSPQVVPNYQTYKERGSLIEGPEPSPAKESQFDEPGEEGAEVNGVEREGRSDCQADGMDGPPDESQMEKGEEEHHRRSTQSPEEIIRLEAEGISDLAKHLSICARSPALEYPSVPSKGALLISCVDDEEGSDYQAYGSC